MTAFERRIIEIFNTHKNMRITTRKKKLTKIYEKNRQKKKFFRIEKRGEPAKSEHEAPKKKPDSAKMGSTLASKEVSLVNCQDLAASKDQATIVRKLEQLRNFNSYFLSMTETNVFNFFYNKKLYQNYLKNLAVFEKEFHSK
jgi:hypothetical protein